MLKRLLASGILTAILGGLFTFSYGVVKDIRNLDKKTAVIEKDVQSVHSNLTDIKSSLKDLRNGQREILLELSR